MLFRREAQSTAPCELAQTIDRLVDATGAVSPVDAAMGTRGARTPSKGYVLQARLCPGSSSGQLRVFAFNDGMLKLSDPEPRYSDVNGEPRTQAVWMDLAPGHSQISLDYTPDQGLRRVELPRIDHHTDTPPPPKPVSGQPVPSSYGTRLLLGDSPRAASKATYMALVAPDFKTASNVLAVYGADLGMAGEQLDRFTAEGQSQIATLQTGEPIPPPSRPSLGRLAVDFFTKT